MRPDQRFGNPIEYDQIFRDEEICQWFRWFFKHWLEPKWYQPAFFCALLFCTGLRRNEARCLAVEKCVTWPTPMIHVVNSKGGTVRKVQIFPQFEKYYVQRREELREAKRQFVFGGLRKGRPVTQRAVNQWWDRCLEAAEVRHLPLKASRATFASYASKIKFKDKDGNVTRMKVLDLKAQLGHASLATTAQWYYQSIPAFRFPRDGVGLMFPGVIEKGK